MLCMPISSIDNCWHSKWLCHNKSMRMINVNESFRVINSKKYRNDSILSSANSLILIANSKSSSKVIDPSYQQICSWENSSYDLRQNQSILSLQWIKYSINFICARGYDFSFNSIRYYSLFNNVVLMEIMIWMGWNVLNGNGMFWMEGNVLMGTKCSEWNEMFS